MNLASNTSKKKWMIYNSSSFLFHSLGNFAIINKMLGEKMKKQVLFVVDERCVGGIAVLLTDIFKLMDTSNLDIDLLVLHDRGYMYENLPKNINIIYGSSYFETVDLSFKDVLKTKNIKTIFKKIRTVSELKIGNIKHRIIKERKKILNKHYDIEVAFKDGFTAVFTAYGDSDVKYHWIQYNYSVANPNRRYPRLFKEILAKFDKIIAVSEGIKKNFNNIYHLDDKVEVIDNPIDTQRIKKLANQISDITIDKNKFNIICVGRLVNSHKGFDRLINVIDRLNKDNLFEDCSVNIFGSGVDEENLKKQIIDCELQNKIFLRGNAVNPYEYYKDNDLFILPSRYEAFGLVIVESLTLGVPVLVTSNDATDRIVDNGVNGLIVENDDRSLYEGLKYLLENRSIVNKFKENLKEYNYDNSQIICKINSLFE